MMDHQIKLALQGVSNFSEKEMLEIISRFKPLSLKRGASLLQEGETCRNLFFVCQGCFRQYQLAENGEEVIINLFTDNDWVIEYKSFTSQSPARTTIEAIADSEVLVMSLNDIHGLIALSQSFLRLGRILQGALQNQDYQHNKLSPEEKYKLLLSTKPQIIQKFPLKQIASYLGITPETLSRVRRKIIS